MAPPVRKIVLVGRLLTTATLLAAALYYFGGRDFADDLLSLGGGVFAVIFGLVTLNMAVIFLRLVSLFRLFQFVLHPWRLYRAHVIGLVSGLFIFNIAGTIIGRNMELRHAGVSASAVAVLSTLEKGIALAIAVVFLCAGAVVLLGTRASDYADLFANSWLFAGTFGVALAIAAGRSVSARTLRAGMDAVMRKAGSQMLTVLFYSTVSQAIMISVYAGAFALLHPEISLLRIAAAAAIVSFAASMPISVNGWGVREVTSVFAFGMVGVPASEALAVSVAVGACSTFLVLLSGATLALEPASVKAHRIQSNKSETGTRGRRSMPGKDAYLKVVAIVLPVICGVALFFQMHIRLFGSDIAINFSDATSILALAVIAALAMTGARLPVRLPRIALLWLAVLTVLIVGAFLIGASRFGVTPWALNNRLAGWGILLGYVGVGALFVGVWGRRATRRFAEFLAYTGVATVLATIIGVKVLPWFGFESLSGSNFEGFSANRNAYAFQLLVSLVLFWATQPMRGGRLNRITAVAVAGILVLGILLTASKAGILCLIVLVPFVVRWNRSLLKVMLPFVGAGAIYYGMGFFNDFSATGFDISEAVDRVIRRLNVEGVLERLDSVQDGIALWQDYPIFGAGLGRFIHWMIEETGRPLVIHSIPVWVLAEFGLVGFAGIILLPSLWVARFAFAPRGWETRPLRIFGLLWLMFLVFGLVHDIFFQRIFWCAAGVTLGSYAFSLYRRYRPLPDRPKVLHVITSLNRGGAERMLVGLLGAGKDRYKDRENAVAVSLISNSLMTEEARATGARVYELGFRQSKPSLWGLVRLIGIIRREKPDVVQGWMYHGDLAALIALYLSGRRAVTRLAWGIRCSDMDLSNYGFALRCVVRLCTRFSRLPDIVIANSWAGLRVHMALGYEPRWYDVVPNGTDIERFRPQPEKRNEMRATLGLPLEKRVLALVARVDPMKDHDLALRIARADPDLHLLLVGKGTETLDLPPNATALGQRDDVEDVLAAADGLLSSSAYGEGFSNSIVEGMAAGLAPIVTDIGDSSMIVGDTGWVVPPRDEAALSAAVQAFLEMPDAELATLRAKARLRVIERFTLPVAVDRFLAAYREIPSVPHAQDLPADPMFKRQEASIS